MINIKKIKPLFTSLVTTMEKYGADEVTGTLIDPSKMQGSIKEHQKVIAVGTAVRDIKEGDIVKINPNRYAVKKFQENSVKNDLMENTVMGYNIPQVELDGQIYMFLQDRDIEYVVTEYEEEQPDSGLLHTEPRLIL